MFLRYHFVLYGRNNYNIYRIQQSINNSHFMDEITTIFIVLKKVSIISASATIELGSYSTRSIVIIIILLLFRSTLKCDRCGCECHVRFKSVFTPYCACQQSFITISSFKSVFTPYCACQQSSITISSFKSVFTPYCSC